MVEWKVTRGDGAPHRRRTPPCIEISVSEDLSGRVATLYVYGEGMPPHDLDLAQVLVEQNVVEPLRALCLYNCGSFPFTNVPRTVRDVKITDAGLDGVVAFVSDRLPRGLERLELTRLSATALDGLELGSAGIVGIHNCRELRSIGFGPGTERIKRLFVGDCRSLDATPDLRRVRHVRHMELRRVGAKRAPMENMPRDGLCELVLNDCGDLQFEDEEFRGVYPEGFYLTLKDCGRATRVPAMPVRAGAFLCSGLRNLESFDTSKTGAFVKFDVRGAPKFQLRAPVRVGANSVVRFEDCDLVTADAMMERVELDPAVVPAPFYPIPRLDDNEPEREREPTEDRRVMLFGSRRTPSGFPARTAVNMGATLSRLHELNNSAAPLFQGRQQEGKRARFWVEDLVGVHRRLIGAVRPPAPVVAPAPLLRRSAAGNDDVATMPDRLLHDYDPELPPPPRLERQGGARRIPVAGLEEAAGA